MYNSLKKDKDYLIENGENCSKKTLKEMFETSTEIYGDRTGFLVKDDPKAPYTEISYKKFREDVYAFATGLIDMGLKDKKIAVIGENSYRWIVTYMSVVTGVGTIVPIDKELPYDEIGSWPL